MAVVVVHHRPRHIGCDGKLFQIVKRLVSNTPLLLVPSSSLPAGVGNGGGKTRINSANVDTMTTLILDGHREYRRKDELWMRNNIRLTFL